MTRREKRFLVIGAAGEFNVRFIEASQLARCIIVNGDANRTEDIEMS